MLDPPPNDSEILYMLVGCITVQWAVAEGQLDAMVIIIYQNCGGDTLGEKEIPRSLQRKIEYCRKAFNQLAMLGEFQGDALSILDDFQTLKEKRHDLSHGVVGNLKAVNGVFKFTIVEFEGKEFRFLPLEVDVRRFEANAKQLSALGKRANALAEKLSNRFRPEQ